MNTATGLQVEEPLATQPETPPAPHDHGHIGRVVAGSLLGGLAAAIAVVVGPFAGAEEHVVTGAVLVTFALSWATLAVWSTRRTSQPQRWAFAPAAFFGISGVVLLAVTGDPFGWVWPPAAVALTVWMFARVRRDLRSRTRVWLVYPVFAMLLLSAVGGTYAKYHEVTDDGPTMTGQLIDVGGHRLRIDCAGTGSPTVVLEPGLGEPSPAMAWVSGDVAPTTRVCVYDRAGRGWSESASTSPDGVQTATDLHTLLERAGEHGPFVLAGHSAGGIYVLNFARLFPKDVAGVVLLDSMHPEQYTRIDGWPMFYEMFRRFSALMPSLSRLGIGHAMYSSAYADLPVQARNEQRYFWATPRHSRSVRDEFSQLRKAMSEANSLTSLDGRPLVVLTAQKDAEGGWMAAQDDLARLSTNSVHRVIAAATHSSLIGDEAFAGQASQAIIDVVTAVRAGEPVTATTPTQP